MQHERHALRERVELLGERRSVRTPGCDFGDRILHVATSEAIQRDGRRHRSLRELALPDGERVRITAATARRAAEAVARERARPECLQAVGLDGLKERLERATLPARRRAARRNPPAALCKFVPELV